MSNTATSAVESGDPEALVSYLLEGEPLREDDPYAVYAAMRETAPVFESERGRWVLSRYADIVKALRHPGMSMAAVLEDDPRYPTSLTLQTLRQTMLHQDDTEAHRRQRRLVRKAFSHQTVQELRPVVEGLVDGLLDACLERGEFDYMADFVDHIPVTVICRMLGVPEADIPTFQEWNYTITSVSAVYVSDDHMQKVDAATENLYRYLGDLLDERAREPQDDLLTRFIEARDEGDQLSKEETIGMAFLLLVAGSDTTAAFLGAATVALLRNPDQFQELRERPELLQNGIEELLRFEAPVHFGLTRTVTEAPIELEDAVIPVGSKVWTLLSSGNRDPDRFPDPNRLDLEREDPRHLAFSQGMHMCLGAMLARLESRVAFEAVLERLPVLELREERVPWVNHGNLRGISRLMVSTEA